MPLKQSDFINMFVFGNKTTANIIVIDVKNSINVLFTASIHIIENRHPHANLYPSTVEKMSIKRFFCMFKKL